MISWIVRIAMFLASIVTGWFVASDAGNFDVIQMAVSLLLITLFIAIAAFWPSLVAWLRSGSSGKTERILENDRK